jgi:hypothetical protein
MGFPALSNVIWLRPEFTRQVETATVELIRETRRKIAECRQLRAESERVRRGYVERRVQIERLLEKIEADVERA